MQFVIKKNQINNDKPLKDYLGIEPQNYYLLNDKLINLNLPFYDQYNSIEDKSQSTQEVTLIPLNYDQMIERFNSMVDNRISLEQALKERKKNSKIVEEAYLNQKSLSDSCTFFQGGEIQDCSDFIPNMVEVQQQNKNQQFNQSIKISSNIDQNNSCKYCQQGIEENQIQTPCKCKFHAQCFEDILKKQLQKGESRLHCLCEKALNSDNLNIISNLLIKRILQNKLIENQYKELTKLKKFGIHYFLQCQECEFFILNVDISGQSYCPICYKITDFKQQ